MQQLAESPSASSVFLPLSRRRRGSVASISSQVDKESLSQALDSIHTAASRSGTLTVFNEYTSPPSSSAAADSRSIKEELQGGLSGLYSRIRNTVGTQREGVSALDGFDDGSSLRTVDVVNTSNTPSTHQNPVHPRQRATEVSTQPRPLPPSKQSSNQLSPAVEREESFSKETKSDRAAPKKTASSGRPSLGPSGKSASGSIAGPAVAEVNVNASKNPALRSGEVGSSEALSISHDGTSISTQDSRTKQTAAEKLKAAGVTVKETNGITEIDIDRANRKDSIAKNTWLSNQDRELRSPLTSPLEARASKSTTPTIALPPPEQSGSMTAHRQTSRDAEAARLSLAGLKVPQRYDISQHVPVHSSAPSSSMNDGYSEDDMQSVAVGRAESISSHRETSQRGMSVVLSQIKKRVLSKEYWMRDENARDCFYCGDSFSTFRRKHHCRTCGQIFDAKCTSLVSGVPFGQFGTIRVCKPCEGIIDGYDDSSEMSEEESLPGTSFSVSRPRHGSSGHTDLSPTRSIMSTSQENKVDSVPTMAIPATRRLKDEMKRRPAVLEIDAEPRIPRPSSSRSLRSAGGLKSHPSNHKRHHSRSLLSRAMRTTTEELAPFLRQASEGSSASRLPAFHSDNVIDPELADYLSDDDSSGDEQSSIMSTLAGDSKIPDHDKGLLANLLPSRKSSRRLADKYIGIVGRDPETASLSSAKLSNPRSARKRNFSMSSNTFLRPAPRFRLTSGSPAHFGSGLQESMTNSGGDHSEQQPGRKTMRSSSMKGSNAPAIELNKASIQHVRKLLVQLLTDAPIPNISTWERALMPILLRAVEDVNPDVQNGDDIDIRHYVKLKKIPGGRPGDTSYVSGPVFTKNLALKSMSRSISHPNILILTFPLEYTRHKQQYMSLDLLMRQEKEYLQNLVHRIAALRPQIIFCQKNVSGLALEFLDELHIAVAANVKPSVLEAISRCSQTRIITSIDKLAVKPAQAGRCASFNVQTFVYDGKKKSCMFISGCPKELGCTIVLRGAEPNILSNIKRIAEFMVFVVYNLKLETYFLRDEFALIPSYTGAGTIEPDKGRKSIESNQEKLSIIARSREAKRNSDSNVTGVSATPETASDAAGPMLQPAIAQVADEPVLPEHAPLPTFWSEDIELYKNKILSSSPIVQYTQPYLLMRAREQESRLRYLRDLLDQSAEEGIEEIDQPRKFSLITEDMIHESSKGASKKVKEVLRAVQEAEYEKAVHNYQTQKRQWEAYIGANSKLFDPYTHQNIAVLYSVVCTATSVPCSGPDTLALGFYNEHETNQDFEADCTLGQYVEDLCIWAGARCEANGCERKMLEHHRQYVHGTAQLSVTVEHHPCRLLGYEDIILMWSTCRICSQETQVLPMSDNTWKYSFGKYLELAFWGHNLHPRTAICPHDLHKDFMRYFGFKNLAIKIQRDPVTLLEIIVPRTRITWKVTNDLQFKNEVYRKAEDRINRFMESIKSRISRIRIDSILPDKTEEGREEVERLAKKVEEEHRFLIQKLQEKYMGSRYYEVIPLNRAVRATQEKVAEWDKEFSQFDRNFFPSEKDIRRLATLQLKKIFLDKDDSVVSLTSTDDSTSAAVSEIDFVEKSASDEPAELSPSTRNLSPEKTQDMLSSVVENHAAINESNEDAKTPMLKAPSQNISASESQEVEHLDLAMPSTMPGSETTQASADTSSAPSRQETLSTQSSWSLSRGSSPELERRPTDKQLLPSQIPRPSDGRRSALASPSKAPRAQSQPPHANAVHESSASSKQNSTTKVTAPLEDYNETAYKSDKKSSSKFNLGIIRNTVQPSMIPRSITRRKDTNVSSLARHFEQLSREFEKERLRDRRQRAAANRQSRAFPAVAAKPIIEIYRNVHEAVAERGPADEDIDLEHVVNGASKSTEEVMDRNTLDQTDEHGFHAEGTAADETGTTVTDNEGDGRTESDGEVGGAKSDEERSVLDIPSLPEADGILSPSEAQLDLKLDLPKHEKTSLMKILTNFWAERSASGWQPLDYPLRTLDHIFADSDIIIREDEPSSLIAFALDSDDYAAKLQSIHEKSMNANEFLDKPYVDDLFLTTQEQMGIERSLLQSTGTHLKYQFQEGSAKMLCKVFYAEQFDAVRRKCGVADRIVESLSRCLKWNSKGGKTKSVFLKTLDDRLVLKSLSQVETQAFLRFAPAYFQLMGEALFHELPSVIAKMLGFYQIIIKNPATGVEFNWFLLVMENLFYDRAPTRIFDLKGSMRNRKIQSTGEQDEVLLDENMVEFIYESPLFTREHSKKLLRASVWNDTLFLSRQNVMDYSLMVAIDEKKKELVVGIIDCIRTYTWDKKLESWMKDRGKNRPTVTSPREYKNRFREAMGRYVLQAPT